MCYCTGDKPLILTTAASCMEFFLMFWFPLNTLQFSQLHEFLNYKGLKET